MWASSKNPGMSNKAQVRCLSNGSGVVRAKLRTGPLTLLLLVGTNQLQAAMLKQYDGGETDWLQVIASAMADLPNTLAQWCPCEVRRGRFNHL